MLISYDVASPVVDLIYSLPLIAGGMICVMAVILIAVKLLRKKR